MKHLISILIISLIGCQVNKGKIQKEEMNASNNVSKIQAYLETVDSTITAVKNGASVASLSTASTAVKNAMISAIDALTSLNTLNGQINTLSETVTKQNLIIENYHEQWIGDRTKFWWHVFIAGWAVLGIAAVIFRVMAGGLLGGSFMAKAATEIIRFLPLGNVFAWAANMFHKTPAVAA